MVLVDEYDKPILDALEAPEVARANRDYLRGLYGVIKDSDAHVQFTFLTGISKFSKVNLSETRPEGQRARIGAWRPSSLAYRIVPFDPDGAHRDREPSLEAFYVDLERNGRGSRVALVDSRGDMIDDTMRRVRLLDGSQPSRVLVLLVLLPLAVGVGVTVARWKITST